MPFVNFAILIIFPALMARGESPAAAIGMAHKEASDQPKSQGFVNAGMVFDWEQSRIYQVYTRPGRITDISLEPLEMLISVAGGDSQRWAITESASGKDSTLKRHLFIKPHTLGISNNLVITTDKRVYHIELHSLESVPYQAAVSWRYPGTTLIIGSDIASLEKATNKQQSPLTDLAQKQLNFSYHFIAKDRPAWMPRRVFDDGHKTYIEFPESMQDQEAPILWSLSRAKEPETINYRRYKNFYIVDHRVDILELTIGGTSKISVAIEKEGV